MPTHPYGSGDKFHTENSHVNPALLWSFHDAVQADLPEVVGWGSGAPKREFLRVGDLVAASVFVMRLDGKACRSHTQPMPSKVNVGSSLNCSVSELAKSIARVTGCTGLVTFVAGKPDGRPRKLMDVSRLWALGWRARGCAKPMSVSNSSSRMRGRDLMLQFVPHYHCGCDCALG